MFRDYLLDYLYSREAGDGRHDAVSDLVAFNPDKIDDNQLPTHPLETLPALGVGIGVGAILALILYVVHNKGGTPKEGAEAAPSQPKGLGSLFLAVFLDSLGAFAVLPFLGVLIVTFGCTAFQASCVAGCFAFMQAIGSGILGTLADRYEKRMVLLLTLGVCAACLGLQGLTMLLPRRCDLETMTCLPYTVNGRTQKEDPGINLAWIGMLLTRALAGFFASTVSVIQTMVAEMSPEETRAGNIGQVMGFFALGMIGGPVIGGLFFNFGLETLCYTSSSITIVNVIYAYLTLDTTQFNTNKVAPAEGAAKAGEAPAAPVSPLKDACKSVYQHPFTGVILFSTLFATGAPSMFISGSGLFVLQVFHWKGWMIGVSTALAGILGAFAQIALTGPIVGKLGEVKAIIVGNLIRTATMVLYVIIIQPATPWILMPFGIVCGVMIDAPLQSLISKYAPPHAMGTLIGFMQSLRSLGEAIAPPLAGKMLDVDLKLPMFVGAAMALICALMFVPFMKK